MSLLTTLLSSAGGGNAATSYDGEVSIYSSLPTATDNNGKVYLVETDEGDDQAGLYRSNGTIWSLIGQDYDTLDDIPEGTTNKHFTTTSESNISANNAKVSNVNSDWDAVDGDSEILNKPNLASSATTDTTNATNISSGTLPEARLPDISFDSLASKGSGTGNYETTGSLTCGKGGRGVSLTVNDGYGNANIAFNHKNGVPEASGNSARITVNTDSSSNASVGIEVKSGTTSGVATALTTVLDIKEDSLRFVPSDSILNPSFFKITNTNTTTNINTTNYSTVQLAGTTAIDFGGYFEGDGQGIKCLFNGYIRASTVICFAGVVTRGSINARFSINGTGAGAISKSSYIRNSNGHTSASETLTDIFQVSANDIVTVLTKKNATSGTITLESSGTSMLLLERLS